MNMTPREWKNGEFRRKFKAGSSLRRQICQQFYSDKAETYNDVGVQSSGASPIEKDNQADEQGELS